MRAFKTLAACATLIVVGVAVQLWAQGAPTPAGGQAPAGRPATFPAQQRPPGDPELIARGQTLYDISCRSCHGADLRGGDLGGPNLLRSQLVLNDQQGERMLPVIRDGVSNPGMLSMPPQPLSGDDVRAVAEYIHSIVATGQRQGAPPPGQAVELNILVGDSAAGQAYFAAQCGSCHSPTGDLVGIGARILDVKELQNTWVRGGPGGRQADRSPVTVTVTLPSGEGVTGRLDRLDDFIVVLTDANGRPRSFSRRGSVPSVEISDPLERHLQLLSIYTDKDIHDVTAYLTTLK